MNEEALYDLVAAEMQEGHRKPGLWTKSFADADGDQTKAVVIYIRQRVAQLKQEAIEAARQQQERKKQNARASAMREDEKASARLGRRLGLVTKCKKCGFEGKMRFSFFGGSDHCLFARAVKCPECKNKFDWYDHLS